MSDHTAVRVKVGNIVADIDEMLAPLIKEMWKSSISTLECCQEIVDDMAWICFPDEHEFKKFMNIVGDNTERDDPSSLYCRMNSDFHDREDNDNVLWEYHCLIEDDWHDHEYKSCDFRINIAIWFPQSDIPLIIKKIKQHYK